MRFHSIPICLTLLALMTATPTLAVEAAGPGQGTVDIRILDEPIQDLDDYADQLSGVTSASGAASLRSLVGSGGTELAPVAERSAGASDVLLVPYFEVDRTSADGATTMLAMRNETDGELPVRILYVSALGGTVEVSQDVTLAPAATRTINLRDVQGLARDPDGFARGLVVLGVVGDQGDGGAMLSGDFFYIDPATDYATGNTLIDMSLDAPKNELCAGLEHPLLQQRGDLRPVELPLRGRRPVRGGQLRSPDRDRHRLQRGRQGRALVRDPHRPELVPADQRRPGARGHAVRLAVDPLHRLRRRGPGRAQRVPPAVGGAARGLPRSVAGSPPDPSRVPFPS